MTTTTTTVAVHGATGTQGSRIAARLHAAGFHVRPLDTGSADLADLDSLVHAYSTVDAVVMQLPALFDPIVTTYADHLLSALAKANVPRAVFNPAVPLPPVPVGVPFVDARVSLVRKLPETVGVAATIGPAVAYLENFLMPWSKPRITERGELAYPLPEARPCHG